MESSVNDASFEMSKILITGPLHPSFPYIVLKELALEAGWIISLDKIKRKPKYYAKVYKKISKLQPKKIGDLSETKDLENASYVVNPCIDWKLDRNSLWTSLMFLKGFQGLYQEDNMRRVYTFQKFGLQTNVHKFSYNACVLFALARIRDIQVDLEIDYEELFYKVAQNPVPSFILDHSEDEPDLPTISLESPSPISIGSLASVAPVAVQSVAVQSVGPVPAGPLVAGPVAVQSVPTNSFSHQITSETSLQISIDSVPEDTQVIVSVSIKDLSFNTFDFSKEFQNIQTLGELFDDMEYIRKHFQPLTNEQAIVAAALNHYKDLTLCSNPLLEYKTFTSDELEYQPLDKSLKYLFEKNPNYSDLWVYFNPYLPKTLYRSPILKHHIRLFSTSDVPDYLERENYEILQELHLEENFHLGWLPSIHNEETPISLEIVNQLKSDELICYGVRDERLTAMTWSELADLFENTNLFVNPTQKKSLFEVSKIERLIKLAKWVLDPVYEHRYLFFYIQDSTRMNIQRCLQVCERLILTHKEEFKSLQKYVKQFQEMVAGDQIGIRECMERLFETIMIMRGWKSEQPYPIEIVPYSDPNETEQRTFDAISRLDEWNEQCGNFIYQLPLILWKNEFYLSREVEQGFTIGDRIKIIKSTEGVNSCIRMSSNVLGASYCFYCRLLGLKERFDIRNLHSII